MFVHGPALGHTYCNLTYYLGWIVWTLRCRDSLWSMFSTPSSGYDEKNHEHDGCVSVSSNCWGQCSGAENKPKSNLASLKLMFSNVFHAVIEKHVKFYMLFLWAQGSVHCLQVNGFKLIKWHKSYWNDNWRLRPKPRQATSIIKYYYLLITILSYCNHTRKATSYGKLSFSSLLYIIFIFNIASTNSLIHWLSSSWPSSLCSCWPLCCQTWSSQVRLIKLIINNTSFIVHI